MCIYVYTQICIDVEMCRCVTRLGTQPWPPGPHPAAPGRIPSSMSLPPCA